MLIRTAADIKKIPTNATAVRIQSYLSASMINQIFSRCPNLKGVILTNTAGDKTPASALDMLKKKGVACSIDSRTQGAPAKLTRKEVKYAQEMEVRGDSYARIGKVFRVSASTAWRALKGETEFKRRREEY